MITRGDGKDQGGTMHGFPVELQNGALSFPDRVPHAIHAVSARKVLVADQDGVVERLEFDRGLGLFERYYSMTLRRRHGEHPRA